MLYLHPPFYNYEGVPVVGDYHDPRQFYYFPNRPQLAVDEQNRPAIRLLLFRENLDEVPDDSEEAVGFLVFDTSLAWPEDTIRKVARKIEQDLDLDDPPRLAPLPYKNGNVRLIFLGKQTEVSDPAAPPDAQPPAADDGDDPWVPLLETSGVPSLYGENRAIFSARLSKKAAALMLGSFEGFLPAGVVYDLGYVGMQRAFNVHVEADWEQIYHHLGKGWKFNLVFVDVDVSKIIDELEEKKLITFKASLEGVGEEAMEAEFNKVRRELQDFVLEKFFKPEPNPNRVDFAGDARREGTLDTIQRVVNMAHHWPSAGYSRRELDVTEIRRISIDYTVARAVERRIAPQAHISLFYEDFALTRDQVVTVVDGDDALWRTVDFDVVTNADFAADGIHSLAADIFYGQEPDPVDDDTGDGPSDGGDDTDVDDTDGPDGGGDVPATWSMLFDGQTDRIKKTAWFDPAVGQNMRYRYAVHFAPNALPGPGASLSSGWREHDGHQLVLSPRELYRRRTVEAQVVRAFPFERYPQVHVHLRYEDPDSGWVHEDSALLDAANPRFELSFRTAPEANPEVDYRYTFLAAGGESIETPWSSTDDDLVLITDPRPQELAVRILVAGDRSRIANLIIDLRYDDPENGVRERGSVVIDATNISQLHRWTVPLVDPSRRRYEYSQTLIDIDGNLSQTGWTQSERTTLAVGEVFARLMEIQPEVIGAPFADHQVERVVLDLHYEDLANGVVAEKQMLFAQPGKGETWRVQLQDPAARGYNYSVTYVLTSGFERRVGPSSSRDTFLLIPSAPPAP